LEFLSDIELYYTLPARVKANTAVIEGEEFKHISRVMRHQIGDTIYFTTGMGIIYYGEILSIEKELLTVSVIKHHIYKNNFSNIIFCLPKLKHPDRLEFALEKCTELGITRFVVHNSLRAISKGEKLERWNKILLTAMKQSLRSFLPVIEAITDYKDLIKLPGEKLIFDQNAEQSIDELILNQGKNYYFIFGPEGGLSQEELNEAGSNNIFKIAENRLRSETAVIKCAAIITHKALREV